MSYRNALSVSLIALAAAFATPAAMAADSSADGAKAAADASATADFTDQQLSTYADTHAKVEAMNQDYAAKINAAATPDEKQNLTDEKNQKLAETVQASGMTVEQYNQIYMASKSDPTLETKLQAMQSGGAATGAGESTTQ
ncbi:MAG: DUF4168 domain-containing protein [Alphaproteobacteria bacterium]|nr:DUF4168 domain-containing protein [Alphaproteobacteria bacterium]